MGNVTVLLHHSDTVVLEIDRATLLGICFSSGVQLKEPVAGPDGGGNGSAAIHGEILKHTEYPTVCSSPEDCWKIFSIGSWMSLKGLIPAGPNDGKPSVINGPGGFHPLGKLLFPTPGLV